MGTLEVRLGQLLKSRRDEYVAFALYAVESNPAQGAGAFGAPELGQMVDGFLALITEALEQRGTETMDFYLETVIPGLIGAGNPVSSVVFTVASWALQITDDVSQRVAPADRDATMRWLARFFAGYLANIVRVGNAVERP